MFMLWRVSHGSIHWEICAHFQKHSHVGANTRVRSMARVRYINNRLEYMEERLSRRSVPA